MTLTNPPDPDVAAPRRVVLIDLDWQEADLVPDLLRRPEISVRLVAGETEANAGLRVAELCGLPHTTELADLTREVFDLALLGEHSARRPKVERLLTALGTPIASPRSFLGLETGDGEDTVESGVALTLDNLDQALALAIPDLSPPSRDVGGEEIPEPDDRLGWERALADWAQATGATAAEIWVGSGSHVDRLARVGAEDPLLGSLAHAALTLDQPHVVARLEGTDRGRAWGTWPFRTRNRSGLLAAACIDPVDGRAAWEHWMQAVRVAWARGERDRRALDGAGNASWLAPDAFGVRLTEVIERHRAHGSRYAVHRLRFDDAPDAVDGFCEALPRRMRESDGLCRTGPRDVLLLHQGSQASFSHVRRRLVALWEDAWAGERPLPAPPFLEERIELQSREDAQPFLAAAARWLPGPQRA